ncbi:DUF5606 domain-containing protein [Hymenobacter caeli]|uniref:DUF5606 domain-containing protein n=1 Tax=Hymenobacter caeli TaxID=2735894 RepID=A0ABX2FL44_9BACT|nr:DUF5606 domain-containing protein [Hymenobacter caeli]NRT17836.1 hypothetical protein [Hymenobacter caeli]
MPYELKEIAAISGMPGLYRLLKAARHGVLVESLDARAARSMAPARNKVSLLSEISIYTTDYDVNVPLADVFEQLHAHYGPAVPVTSKSSEAELADFMAHAVPDYDRDRVYTSDIKKLAAWYGIVAQHLPYQEAAAEETATEQPAAEGPAPGEPLSTGGVINAPEPPATAEAAANPEAAPAAAPKKSRKKAE